MDKTNLEQASDLLKEAGDQIEALIGEEHPMIALGISAALRPLIARLGHLGGGQVQNLNKPIESTPVTNLFGQKIKGPKLVEPEEIVDPKELERKLFAAKVDRLQEGIFLNDNAAILDSYKGEQGVVRGVAKRAGLEDFKDATITGEYLDKIREGLNARVEAETKLKAEKASIPAPAKPVTAPADTNINSNQDKK